MAYDPKLAGRIRAILAGRRGVTEKAMFGGLAFLLDGRMFCGVLRDELLARVGPAAHDDAMAEAHVRVMDFTGRPMRGYVFVGPAATSTASALERWVDACEAHVASLPAKVKRKRPASAHSRAARTSSSRTSGASLRRGARRPSAR